MASKRGTTNRNSRGSSYERKRRRQWLVEHFGDGIHVACFIQRSPYCEWVLDEDTVSPDRISLGVDGGSYRRGNIRPACRPCQCHQGGVIGAARRAANKAARLAGLTP
jgi:hypothetical protein